MKFSVNQKSLLLAVASTPRTLTLQFTYVVGLILVQLNLNYDPGVSAAVAVSSSSRFPEAHGNPTTNSPQIVLTNGVVPHNRIFYSNGVS